MAEVRAIWRYPVKSMLGETLAEAEVTERGLLGDRAYGLIDLATGKLVSTKQPRRWGALTGCRARLLRSPRVAEPTSPAQVRLPDGTTLATDEPAFADRLGAWLGRAVDLATVAPPGVLRETLWPAIEGYSAEERVADVPIARGAPPGTFFDHGVVHLISTATLDHLTALYPEGRFDVRRFRPNLLIETGPGETGLVEHGWVGRELRVGATLHLRVVDPCPRCVVTTLPWDGLPADPGILRTIARHSSAPSATFAPGVLFPATAGVYAEPLQGGVVRPGDRVRLV